LGEHWRDHFLGLDVNTRAAMLVAAGLPEIGAVGVAAAMDRRMFDHILRLYRSEPYLEDWAFDPTATYPPGLVLWGRDDPYQAAEFGRVAAAASGARFHELGCGHWWQVERPDEVAAELTAHWSNTRSAAA
jgi:pimeloyl-ACP methyl ester carboxylesterase